MHVPEQKEKSSFDIDRMKSNTLRASLILTLMAANVVTSFGQGINFYTPEELSEFSEIDISVAGYATAVPSSFSMERYAPPVLYQDGSSCVGFSAAYCALSTMWNRVTNTTHPNHKYVLAFDPYFNYSFIKSRDGGGCKQGVFVADMFESLMELGNKRDLMPPVLGCKFGWHDGRGEVKEDNLGYFDASYPFRIDDYGIVDLARTDWLNVMKQFLANQIPVVIGSQVCSDFAGGQFVGAIDSDGVYSYSNDGDSGCQGHAMCIIAYDDNKAGGSFLVQNSWGTDWGLDGRVWIKYGDLHDMTGEAWVIIPEDWYENVNSPDDYAMNFKSTVLEEFGLIYGRAYGEGGVYEGFYAEGNKVLGYELYDDGGICFGYYTDFIKDGMGIYWDANGNKFRYEAKNGEVLDVQAGFGADSDTNDASDNYIMQLLSEDGPLEPFYESFEEVKYNVGGQD